MELDEYKQRSTPRLAAIDELDQRCQWDKFLEEIPLEKRAEIAELRKRRERLMKEQVADEVAAGL